MELQDKIIVVTGAANGIGQALARRFSAERARQIVAVDLDHVQRVHLFCFQFF